MTNGPIKKSKKSPHLKKKVIPVTYTKRQANKQTLKNEKYAAERDYDFADPSRPGEKTMAKIRFKNATRKLKKYKK
jgi:hypothetical protein